MARYQKYKSESFSSLSVEEIRELLSALSPEEFSQYDRLLSCDTRKGVLEALERTRNRLSVQDAERARVQALYDFDRSFMPDSSGGFLVGLDEVGRGPLAGPLAVGAVVLPPKPLISGLNDSKQVNPARREIIAQEIRQFSLASAVVFVEPAYIDAFGMSSALRKAFSEALAQIEEQDINPEVVLLDGNPLHFDPRERNVIKGDAKSASIGAASIIAKVKRDAYMEELHESYPDYHWNENKGYASAEHILAIKNHGLSPYHRSSFCQSFVQPTLF